MSDNSTTVTGWPEIVDVNLSALQALCRRFHVSPVAHACGEPIAT